MSILNFEDDVDQNDNELFEIRSHSLDNKTTAKGFLTMIIYKSD
uniref:Uncharacterized protein n=1 Tax=Schistosoma haematobium TaxID=6185 RepID=A0A094ZSH2_SCHHA